VARRHPAITRLIKALGDAGATGAAMSGSGSAVYGLFPTRKRAELAASALAAGRRRTIVTRTLGHADYRALARIKISRRRLDDLPGKRGIV
jgi:4-diphosphocytidyl-2C-methyl-D-erythritol kinase